jgi:WD40 repeat protein/tetratricopeptide (TPR) repeat protein/archaellum biogenesis ATPase FlaH
MQGSDSIPINNERSLQQLAWVIEASVGQFKLILARCNFASARKRLVERLCEISQVEICILVIKESSKTLYSAIREELQDKVPPCLMVLGLESVQNIHQMLISANQVREEFRNHFPFPLVLWIDDELYKQLMQVAPDLESWAITKNFAISKEEIANYIRELSEQFFTNSLTPSRDDYLALERELEVARHDLLNNDEQFLSLELEAHLESLFGFVKQVNNKLDAAVESYQKSLAIWKQVNNIQPQGKILENLAFCYYLKAWKNKDDEHIDWVKTQEHVQEYIEYIVGNQRLDLIPNLIVKFHEILKSISKNIPEKEGLKNLTEQAVELHENQNESIELARHYGLLAELALIEKEAADARKFAQKALNISSPDKSLYLYIMARAQELLGQFSEAISSLETARDIGDIQKNLKLYLNILKLLQRLYFEQKEYLKAYEVKQQWRSVEQQFGLRGFIGAGRLQAAREVNFAVETLHGTSQQQENVSLEIIASGRKLDVDRLIERIGRRDCKLIVIYGQSGVGKSSLVNAGIVPSLKNKAIGVQDNLVVTIRVYTNWMEELKEQMREALRFKERGEDAKTQRHPDGEVGTGLEAILEQLCQFQSHNLRPVLIFDQFEEFFFVDIEPKQRQRFFDFLGECLNILSVKLILSLREDYIHYLLKYNRLPKMGIINNDILSKNVLYELGNFSPADSHKIIEQLTERSNFHLEPALIDELVKDLAGDLGEVRPIELQIVGAQLQTENITTLAKYQECGTKEELVKRYLQEVVDDCGKENQQVAQLLLYLLTDEKGTRPLKTRTEIERDLQPYFLVGDAHLKQLIPDTRNSGEEIPALLTEARGDLNKLDLVLQIFVKSGLVLLLPESPAARYQLVHDYLADFIRRQQEPKLTELMAALEREKKQRLETEEQLKQSQSAGEILTAANKKATHRIRIGSGILVISLVIAGIAALQASRLIERAQQITTLERRGVAAWQLSQFRGIEALVLAVDAGEDLQALVEESVPEEYPAASPVFALQTIFDNIYEQNQLKGHTSTVNSASFSPDGKRILTASSDNTARVWDVSGKLLATLTGHTSYVISASFSPDGKRILTASSDNTARVWDVSGKLLATLTGHTSRVNSASFSPDGKRILTASEDNTARVWDVSGKLLATLTGHTSTVNSASFSPDGKRILTASEDNTARVWDVSGKLLATLTGHTSTVNSASFSPDGKRILTASEDNTARVWEVSGKLLATLTGHTSYVISASFSPDGKRILTASDDNTARVWEVSGKLLATLTGHTSRVNSASFSPDGKRILTASWDNTARVWQYEELEGLLSNACKWLNDYLVTHPKDLIKLEKCQNEENKVAAAELLVKEGEQQAKAGNIEEAIVTFRTALKWKRDLKFEPQAKAQEFANKGEAERLVVEGERLAKEGNVNGAITKFEQALELDENLSFDPKAKAGELTAKALIEKGKSLAKDGKVKEAIAAYTKAQELDSKVEINADSWALLCIYGSLRKQASDVMFTCEKAVALADSQEIRFIRGLARALTGNYQGAIEDFEAYIASSKDQESKTRMQGWVKSLRAGKNPFTDEELKRLLQN